MVGNKRPQVNELVKDKSKPDLEGAQNAEERDEITPDEPVKTTNTADEVNNT